MMRILVTASVRLTLLLPVLSILVQVEAAAVKNDFDPNSRQPCSFRDLLMEPTYEEQGEHYFVWQIPPNPKSILIIGHGLDLTPFSFFDPSPKCELCLGHPEYRRVVLEALRRGYAVIVVKSIGLGYVVAFPIEESEDVGLVTTIVQQWRRKHSLEHLPIAIWAHSKGGALATALTITLRPTSALVNMDCLGLIEVEELATPSTFPPTFLVLRPRDQDNIRFNFSGKAPAVMALLKERGIEVHRMDLWPKQIFPLYFSERIRCMSDNISQKIYSALKAAGWLDENDYLTKNNRDYDWKVVALKENAVPICTASGDACFADDVEQELSNAYAEHSFSSDANDEVFPWLDSKMASPIDNSGTLWAQM